MKSFTSLTTLQWPTELSDGSKHFRRELKIIFQERFTTSKYLRFHTDGGVKGINNAALTSSLTDISTNFGRIQGSLWFMGFQNILCPKNNKRKTDKIQILNYIKSSCIILCVRMLLLKIRINTFWSKSIDKFWSGGLNLFWPKKLQKKNWQNSHF